MISEEIVIRNPSGLHARPASDFILLAKTFQSQVTLQKKGEGAPVNAKSVMKVLSLGLVQGDCAVLSVSGPDEEVAFKALSGKLVNSQD